MCGLRKCGLCKHLYSNCGRPTEEVQTSLINVYLWNSSLRAKHTNRSKHEEDVKSLWKEVYSYFGRSHPGTRNGLFAGNLFRWSPPRPRAYPKSSTLTQKPGSARLLQCGLTTFAVYVFFQFWFFSSILPPTKKEKDLNFFGVKDHLVFFLAMSVGCLTFQSFELWRPAVIHFFLITSSCFPEANHLWCVSLSNNRHGRFARLLLFGLGLLY